MVRVVCLSVCPSVCHTQIYSKLSAIDVARKLELPDLESAIRFAI